MTHHDIRSDIVTLRRDFRRGFAVLKWMAVANLAATSATLAVALVLLFRGH